MRGKNNDSYFSQDGPSLAQSCSNQLNASYPSMMGQIVVWSLEHPGDGTAGGILHFGWNPSSSALLDTTIFCFLMDCPVACSGLGCLLTKRPGGKYVYQYFLNASCSLLQIVQLAVLWRRPDVHEAALWKDKWILKQNIWLGRRR